MSALDEGIKNITGRATELGLVSCVLKSMPVDALKAKGMYENSIIVFHG
jgi:hypothetical protein